MFILQVDASNTSLGFALLQEELGVLFPVAYGSKKLSPTQQRYSTIEKEALAIVEGVKKFEPYLYGKEFLLQSDHRPLTTMNKKRYDSPRIMRWSMYLQRFKFSLEHISGSENRLADYLSRSIGDGKMEGLELGKEEVPCV